MWTISQAHDNMDSYIYSKTDDAALTLTFMATKYWVEGSTDPIYGSAEINGAKISLNGEHKNNYVYYKSRLINQTDSGSQHNLVIKNVPHRGPISFSRLLYNYIPSITELPRNGLIRVYYNEMEREGTWTIDNERIFTNEEGASASCHFNGMKAYIYANKCPDGGLFGVYIDDEFQDIINLQSTDSPDSIVYESNDLPFGQHKIEVRSVSPKKTTLICFLYRPHLIFDALVYDGKFWTEHSEIATIPKYGQGSGSSTKTGVRCTRFWLVGFKGRDYGSFNVQVSANGDTILDVDVSCSSEYESTFYSVLLYESPVFEYAAHDIRVEPLDGSTVAISDLIFSQQPKDAVIIYGKDLKMSGSFFYDSRFDTYGINTAASTFQFSYCGDKFYSFGLHCWSCSGEFTVTDNDRDLTTTGSAYQSTSPPTQLQPLCNFEPGFGDHEITISPNQNSKNIYISYIFYLTYSNPPFGRFDTLTKDDIIESLNAINTYDDYIELPVIGSKVVFEYGGSNFTLEGYLGPASGNVNIYDGDSLLHSGVPLYREENKFSWFYSSAGRQDGIHRITIVNCNGNPVYISKLCYNPTNTL